MRVSLASKLTANHSAEMMSWIRQQAETPVLIQLFLHFEQGTDQNHLDEGCSMYALTDKIRPIYFK